MEKNDHKPHQLLPPSGANDELLLPWLRLAHQLSPLVGENGFCALFGRASRLVAPQFEWLGASHSGKTAEAVLASLQEKLASVDAVVSNEGNAALLQSFTKLLAALIGEALTNRILNSAAYGEDEQKNAQEHK
jgi:hypothetical protein